MTTTYRFRGTEPPTASSRASILEPSDNGEGVYELYLSDPIDSWGGWWGVSAQEFQASLSEVPADAAEIRLYINSPGGEVWDAMAIVNQLRRHKARTVAVVDGIAASAASIIAVTCDETIMGIGAQMMIHDAWNVAVGDEADMLAMADRLGKSSNALADIYAGKAGGTRDDWRELMRAETWYYGAEAVEAGLADSALGGQPDEGTGKASLFDLSMFRHAGRAQAPAPRMVARSDQPRDGVRPSPQTPVSSEPGNHNRKENAVDNTEFLTGLRTRLGVTNAEADEATILAALDEALDERADEQAPTASIPEGTVLVDATQFEELKAQAAEGAQARTQQIAERRDALVNAAVADGRISPANRTTWRERLDENEVGTTALLNTLPKSTAVPVNEIGYTGGEAESSEDTAYSNIYGTQKEA